MTDADGGRGRDPDATVCPRCAVGCSLRYDEGTGRAAAAGDAPVNREGRLCPKGIAAFDGLDEDRLTDLLVRVDGDLEPVSWAAALDRVEAAFDGVRERHGPGAMAFFGAPRCTNEENYLFAKLARLYGSNTVDNRARSCHSDVTSAMRERLGSGGTSNSLADLTEADAFLVVGANPAEQQPIAFNSYVRPTLSDGATLIHVDPRANRTTRAADTHLAPRPGTDGLLVTLLAATVLDEGLVDESFVAERTTGFDAYADRLRSLDVAAQAPRTGVDAGRIRDAARAFGRADRAAVLVGTGVEGEDATAPDALVNLLLLTGNLGRPGTGMNPLRGLVNEQGANDVGARPSALPGYRDVTDPDARSRVAAEWGAEPPATPGLSEPEAVRAFGDDVHGAFVLGENPAVSKLDDDRVARGFEALDFLVVQDVSHTETTAYADVVLPASAWAEKSGTVTNLDRQVQRLRRHRAPPGDARPDRAILQAVGARVTGAPEQFEYDGPRAVFEEMTAVNPLYAGMTYDGVADGGQRWPFPEGATSGTQVLHRGRFASGDRRAAFDSAPLDAADRAGSGRAEDDTLTLLTRNRVNESGPDPSGAPRPDVSGAAHDAVTDGGDAGTCWIHPADARPRDIEDGDPVVVTRDGEAVRAEAHLTDDVRTDAVFLDGGAATPLLGEDAVQVRVAPTTA